MVVDVEILESQVFVSFDPSSEASCPFHPALAHSCISFCLCDYIRVHRFRASCPLFSVSHTLFEASWLADFVSLHLGGLAPYPSLAHSVPFHSRGMQLSVQCFGTSRMIHEHHSAPLFSYGLAFIDTNQSVYFSTVL